jgi:6-phosphogluconolactonase (cycloisomerase 2 family)
MLYVANEVSEHEGLARGTVESFHIHPADGRLTLSGRTALSLSATRPRHMAVSANGELLAVAAYGGGIYNLIAISADGSLGQVGSIFKDAGCGPHALQASAHPHTLFFDAGQLLSSDFGRDRLSIFALEDGRLRRRRQRFTGAGSGPGACVLHPSRPFVYAWHGLEDALVCYRYDGESVGEAIQRVPLSAGALAVHPSGRMLYTAPGAWQIDVESGRLSRTGAWSPGGSHLVVSPDGTSVILLDGASGSIDRATADRRTGEVHCKTNVAVVNQPRSIALKTI